MNTFIMRFFAAGIFFLLTFVSFGQAIDCKAMGLKGNVKSISETQYKLNDLNPGLNELLRTDFSFNKRCGKTEEITTDLEGEIVNKHVVVYDKSGNVVSEDRETPNVAGYFATRYVYNASKQLSKKEIRSNKKLIATHIYYYDGDGNVKRKEIKKIPGYDISDEEFDYKYDEKNRLVEEVSLDGKRYNRTTYAYNDKDQLVRRVEYNERGGVTYETDYVYDELDNLSLETSAYRGNSTFCYSYLYEYDDQGNWINKRSLSNNKTFLLQIRIITYY
jgi:hypothetical protein